MRRALASILLRATIALPGAALAAHPAWPHDSTTNVPACQDGIEWDAYVQRLDTLGTRQWQENGESWVRGVVVAK